MGKNLPPCTRGLKAFKKGCPMRPWNGVDGCPLWVDIYLPTKEGERIRIEECVDLYQVRLQYSTNQLLEGNQQAIEKFRNNMSVDGSPKPDPAMIRMAEMMAIQNFQKSLPEKL